MDAGKRKLKIGLVGFGAMGHTHSYAVSVIPFFFEGSEFSAEISAVCTRDPERSRRIAEQFGFGGYKPFDEMLADPDVDIIDICTPNTSHYELAVKAINAGKNVLCEKPLSEDASKAAELAGLARSKGVICGTVFNNRRLAPVIRAKQLIDEGKIGRPLSFSIDYLHDSDLDPGRTVGWKQRAGDGGGTLNDLGPHAIDLIRFLLGDFESVSCKKQIGVEYHRSADGSNFKTDADEAAYITAVLANGACGSITVSKLCHGTNDGLKFEIFGTLGSLKFDLTEPNWLYFYDSTQPNANYGGYAGYTRIECVGRYAAPGGKFPSPKAPAGWLRGHVEAMYRYLEAVYRHEPFSPSFDDGAYVQNIIETACKSDMQNGLFLKGTSKYSACDERREDFSSV